MPRATASATPSLRGREAAATNCAWREAAATSAKGERERASHKGELIKRLNFQEWPFVRVRKAIEISVLSRLTSFIPPPRSIFHRQQAEGEREAEATSEGQDERTERGFHARQYKGTVAPPSPSPSLSSSGHPLSSHLARVSGDDAKSVEADFEFFSEKMGDEATVQVATPRVRRGGDARNT